MHIKVIQTLTLVHSSLVIHYYFNTGVYVFSSKCLKLKTISTNQNYGEILAQENLQRMIILMFKLASSEILLARIS